MANCDLRFAIDVLRFKAIVFFFVHGVLVVGQKESLDYKNALFD